MRKLILATRGSKLALVQAYMVRDMLTALGAEIEIKIIKTKGDKDQKSPLQKIGGKGLFVKDIELALADGSADFAVHSGKDLPYILMDGLMIGANPTPADPRDCLVTKKGTVLTDKAVIGTGSPRRTTECKKFYSNAEYREIRGNVDTRLRKLTEGQYDGIFLAKAGMDRLELDMSDYDVCMFDTAEFIPAACQGILAVECRTDDAEVRELLKRISDPNAEKRFEAERSVFCALEADCSVSVGVHAKAEGNQISVDAMFEGNYFSGSCEYDKLEELMEQAKAALM